MSRRKYLIGILACALAVAVFQYAALVWSMADFHPGGDVDVPDYGHRLAELGRAMSLPFLVPLIGLMKVTGGFLPFLLVVQWVVLPVIYGSAIFYLCALIRRLLRRAPVRTQNPWTRKPPGNFPGG